jgi:hypothetical protein
MSSHVRLTKSKSLALFFTWSIGNNHWFLQKKSAPAELENFLNIFRPVL